MKSTLLYLVTPALGAAAGIAIGARAMFSPRSSLLGSVIFRGIPDDPPRVALTFDDGPDPRVTPMILDILARHGVKATFFVIGAWVERHRDLLRRMHEQGHVIGNHTFHHHRAGAFYRGRYWDDEIHRAEEAIEDALGVTPALFRPPMGIRTLHQSAALRRRGYRVVTWTRSARDGLNSSEARVERLADIARAGDLLALHDGSDRPSAAGKIATAAALPTLIAALRARRIAIAPLEELIGGPIYRSRPLS
jgi:peptidoglycan-N-acetylglucosamine deacetylase